MTITIDKAMEYFQASSTGTPPVMAPANFRISLLNYMPIDMACANRGLIQLRYDCVSTKYTIRIGLAKRFQSNSTMLRVITVCAEEPDGQHRQQGVVLEGDPLGNTFGAFDRNPISLRQQVLAENSETLDGCFRLLAGLYNALRMLGIVKRGDNVPYKRLIGFLGSPIGSAAMGTFLQDPVSGFEVLMEAVVQATGPRDQPVKPVDVTLDRYYAGKESRAATFLNGIVDRSTSKRAWKILRDARLEGSGETLGFDANLEIESHLGEFLYHAPDRGRVGLDEMSSIKMLDALIRRDPSKVELWMQFLAAIFRLEKGYRWIGIPIGHTDNLMLVIGPEVWSDMFSQVTREDYDPDIHYCQDVPAAIAVEEFTPRVGEEPDTCKVLLPE